MNFRLMNKFRNEFFLVLFKVENNVDMINKKVEQYLFIHAEKTNLIFLCKNNPNYLQRP